MYNKNKDSEEQERKPKRAPVTSFTRCRQPMCCEKLTISDDQDADLQIAKHNKAAHDIPYPDWVHIVWDGLERRRGKHEKKPHWKDASKGQ